MTSLSLSLPELVLLEDHGGDWDRYMEAVYGHFRSEFIDSNPDWPDRRWAMKRHPLCKGKEATFWHIISEGKDEAQRRPDLRRCERIRWPRPIIDAAGSGIVKIWRQTRGANELRIALATPDFSYLVILADRGSYVMLWTAFPIDRGYQRKKYEMEYKRATGA